MKAVKLNANTLTVKKGKSIADESISATLYLSQCLRRRGLAYDMTDMSTGFSGLFNCDAPPGFHPTTLIQVMKVENRCSRFLCPKR